MNELDTAKFSTVKRKKEKKREWRWRWLWWRILVIVSGLLFGCAFTCACTWPHQSHLTFNTWSSIDPLMVFFFLPFLSTSFILHLCECDDRFPSSFSHTPIRHRLHHHFSYLFYRPVSLLSSWWARSDEREQQFHGRLNPFSFQN